MKIYELNERARARAIDWFISEYLASDMSIDSETWECMMDTYAEKDWIYEIACNGLLFDSHGFYDEEATEQTNYKGYEEVSTMELLKDSIDIHMGWLSRRVSKYRSKDANALSCYYSLLLKDCEKMFEEVLK